MIFSFKQKSHDFIVQEELPFVPTGKGDAFFVYFEKRNLTTMEIIDFLCRTFHISRKTLGFAGLKDKDAITRQWVSIYKSALKKIGGEKTFLMELSSQVKILSTTWHPEPIGMTTPIKNTFFIRLRGTKHLSQTEKTKTDQVLSSLFVHGFPNLFGEQRFGIEHKNPDMGRKVLEGTLRLKESFEAKFKIQSYASSLFNQYVLQRMEGKNQLLDGDIVQLPTSGALAVYHHQDKAFFLLKQSSFSQKQFRFPLPGKQIAQSVDNPFLLITAPVVGYNLLTPEITTAAGKLEQKFLSDQGISIKIMTAFKTHGIFGLRRPFWALPQQASYHFDGDDVCMQFTLASGVYASVLIEELFKRIG